MLSPSPTGSSRLTGSSTSSSSSLTRFSGKPALDRHLGRRRVAVQLLREHAAGAEQLAHLLGDVDGQADRPALVGERAGDRLADPPCRVRGELEAELVVELLDRADQAEVAFLDEVEERDAGFRVVARDRHDQAQVRLDQTALGGLVALVLQAGELAFLRRGEQRAVADLADVELERIRELRIGGLRLDDGVFLFVRELTRDRPARDQLEMSLRGIRGVRGALRHRGVYRRHTPTEGHSNGGRRTETPNPKEPASS